MKPDRAALFKQPVLITLVLFIDGLRLCIFLQILDFFEYCMRLQMIRIAIEPHVFV